MKKIDLGQMITILANIGVIAGIVFLGFELRQNQLVGRAQTQTAIADARRELTQSDISGPIVDILVSLQREEPLSEGDEIRMAMWTDSWLRHYANVYYQNLQGLYDDDGFEANMQEIEAWLQGGGGERVRNHICQNRDMYSTEFTAVIESMFANPCG